MNSIVENIPDWEWKAKLGSDDEFATIHIGEKKINLKCLELFPNELSVENAIAQLIADAGTTTNKCGKLPSELLELNTELLEKLKQLVRLQKENYGNGMSTHLALITFALECEELINKYIS